jgi:DNA-binding SARP family transcriptional activator
MQQAPCRVHLCGQLRLELMGEHRAPALRGTQARLVLAYLLLHRSRPVSRDALIEALDVGGPTAPGESALAPVLSRLRRAIHPAEIEGRSALRLVLPEPAWVDVEAARALLDEARDLADPLAALTQAREAIRLTDGGLLPELEAPWLTEARSNLHDLRIDALEVVAEAALAIRPAQAEEAARAAVGAAPYRESARAALMRALRARGNVAEALLVYEDLRTLLRDELGTTPGAQLIALHAELLADAGPAAPDVPQVTSRAPDGQGDHRLVERDRELREVDAALARLGQGSGGVLLFEGPAGIGKSALLDVCRTHASGARVLSARCSVLEREYGFGVVRQLFREPGGDPQLMSGTAQAARTALADGGAGNGTFPVLDGLFQLTVNVAARGPLLLCLDDLQWSDPASMRFVAYLAHRIDTVPVLIAAAVRTGEPGTDESLLEELAQGPATVSLRPRPLSGAATAAIVEGRLGDEAHPAFSAACHEVTAGNPLFVRQLLSALAADGVDPAAERAADVRAIGRRAVSRTISLRLAGMPAPAPAVARAVAVLGEHSELRAVAALAGAGEEAAADAVQTLARAEILRAEEPLGFVHPLVREAVYEELPAVRRGLEHARAARLLADLGASAERVAAQLLLTPARADAWVVDRLREAAAVAMGRGAPDAAMALLERAQAEPPPADQRADLALELGESAAFVRGPAGIEPLRRAYGELIDPAQRGRAAIRLSHLLLFVSSPTEGVQLAERAAQELPPDHEDLRQGLLAIRLIGTAFGALGPGEFDRLEAVRRGPRGTGPGARALTAMTAFAAALTCIPAPEASALAREAFDGDGLRSFEVTAPVALGVAALTLGEPAEGLEAVRRYADHARGQGEILGSIGADLWGGHAHILAGDLRAAVASLERAQEGERLWGTKLDAVMGYSAAFLALAWLERGDVARAREVLHRVDAADGSSDGAQFWLATRAELLLAEGRPEDAVRVTERLEGMRPAETHPVWAPWRTLRARALAALGERTAALALAEDDLRLARRVGAPWVIGRGLRILGEIGGAAGCDHVEEAAGLLDGTSARLERAKAHAAVAMLAPDPARAASARATAEALAEQCAASGLLAALQEA